jgi:hypothetical protein
MRNNIVRISVGKINYCVQWDNISKFMHPNLRHHSCKQSLMPHNKCVIIDIQALPTKSCRMLSLHEFKNMYYRNNNPKYSQARSTYFKYTRIHKIKHYKEYEFAIQYNADGEHELSYSTNSAHLIYTFTTNIEFF